MRTFISGLLAGLIVLTNFSSSSATHRRSNVLDRRAKHAALSKRAPDWPVHYWETKIRGVSLSGWLVLEPWITPSIFISQDNPNIVDEYTLSQYGNRDAVKATLVNHWNTFIAKGDLQKIKDAGLNHIKIPIGYWAWDVSQGEPYHQGQLFYLNQAIGWARDVGLKVIITLQGLPGSQNGFDGSGQKGNINWHKNKQNIDRSSNIVKALATWYSAQTDVVVAIEGIASPAGWVGDDFMQTLRQYYLDSYARTRYPYATTSQGAIVQIIPDAGMSLSSWKGFEPPGSFDGVMIDTHYYSIWCSDCASRTYDQHIAAACQQSTSLAGSELWTVVGEWTTSTTDCANLQFGPMGGSTFDGSAANSVKHGNCSTMTGDGSQFTQDYKTFMRAFFEAQTSTFEANSVGWIYNTWKTENAAESSYSAGLAGGWIPATATDRAYPKICSGTPLASLTPVTNTTSQNVVPAAPRFVLYSDQWISGINGPPPVSQVAGYNVLTLSFLLLEGPADKATEWAQLSAAERSAIKAEYDAAGIKLIVSLFGSTNTPTTSGADPIDTANTMAAWVKQYGLDGVDVDYEDFAAINAQDGKAEAWLIDFTRQLRKQLPQGSYIITHAPVAPWFSPEKFNGQAYLKVHADVGDLIDWYNVQFYNQGTQEYTTCDGLLTQSSSVWPHSSLFEIANGPGGVPLNKLVIGKPATEGDAMNGYMEPGLLAVCLAQAKASGWSGGVGVWQFPNAAASWIAKVRAVAFPF
ncbi:hypothetical protein VNI00_011006 [Paramarasmius palmivorus]|uniref:GH18 domain-containing protein n=1 Tax=Paramarasmius palmivorus TaxID=297713 RepID=A0AAW0CFN7_9AGAR